MIMYWKNELNETNRIWNENEAPRGTKTRFLGNEDEAPRGITTFDWSVQHVDMAVVNGFLS